MATGSLFLVVGPSGAGKDSLLDTAKAHFHGQDQVLFPQRYITRPADAGGEDHLAIDLQTFDRMKQGGEFAFSWGAHDLHYGVPQAIEVALDQGRNVVVNVSRAVIPAVMEKYASVYVLSITVKPAVLLERLRGRGRESEEGIQKRLARANAFQIDGPNVIKIDNSGTLAESAAAFIEAIKGKLPL